MSFQIKPATRQGLKPLIVPYGESGTGKTMSALLLSRGIAGPNGRIILGDSESGRGSLYADVIPGGYETFDLSPPFTPARYIEAVDAIENAGADVGIIDSGSHEWDSISGVLDMAMENEARSGKPGLHNWKAPKLEHAKFVQRLLRTKIPFIICLRAKHKSRQVKDERNKTVIVKDDFASPIQADDFIFEATCHFEVMPDHTINLTKHSHPDLQACFPANGTAPINIGHGQKIAQWANGTSKPLTSKPAEVPNDDLKAAKAALWTRAKQSFPNVDDFEDWLRKRGKLDTLQTLSDLNAAELKELLPFVQDEAEIGF